VRLLSAQPKHASTFWVVSRPRRGRWQATIIVKAAYRLVPDGMAIFDEDNKPVASGDFPAEPGTPLRYASDFVPYKPKADFLVIGAAHAPDGKPVKACRVSIMIGDYAKSLAIFGDRRWMWGPLGASPGEPEPFVTLPLGYERAFGGPGFRRNPIGRGADVGPGQPLPNIERLDDLITQSTHSPDPAGFGPLAMTWQPRMTKAGTYDAAWLAERWPWFPADCDWSFFNAAPPDQQFTTLRGDEALVFENMHPERAIYRSRLPGVKARVFIERVYENAERFDEVPLKLDTVWSDIATERLILVWRGVTHVRSPRMRDIATIYTTLEPLNSADDIDIHRAAFAKLKDADPAAEDAAARRAEIDKIRHSAEARIAEALALASSLGQTAGSLMQATGFDAWCQRASPTTEDQMETLQKAIATVKAQDPAKGKQFEDRLKEIDSKLGEAIGQVLRQPAWTRQLVIDALDKGESLAKARLDGLNLASLDFTGADLCDATLRGVALHDARLERANLTGADLTKSDLTNASFAAADLSRADLSDAVVGSATFARARIETTVFAKLDLTGADFTGAIGTAADFTGAALDGARFANATLPRSQFSAARAARADFSNAALQAANFASVKAPGIIMEGADLTNLRASRGADFSDGRFACARAPRSVWQQAILDRADFDRAVLTQAQFPEASLREAHFDRAHLQTTNFDDAVLVGTRFTNANLLRASFERADLTKARVDGCNFYGAGLLDAALEGTTFEGSMIVQTLLTR
jgi:uncharacterized protein YjbI with pentapeptide repeats